MPLTIIIHFHASMLLSVALFPFSILLSSFLRHHSLSLYLMSYFHSFFLSSLLSFLLMFLLKCQPKLCASLIFRHCLISKTLQVLKLSQTFQICILSWVERKGSLIIFRGTIRLSWNYAFEKPYLKLIVKSLMQPITGYTLLVRWHHFRALLIK